MDQSHEVYGIAITSALFAPWASHFLSRLARYLRVPPVLAMLAVGMVLRQIHGDLVATKFQNITSAALDVSLGAMGLQIGSHLNEEAIGPYKTQILKFFVVFVPCVFLGMLLFIRAAYGEEMAIFAPIIASIALERSSAECMLGICETRAEGPFSSVTMCTSALLDVTSLIGFVVFSANIVVGSSFAVALKQIALTLSFTGAASSVCYGIARMVKEPLIVLAISTSALALFSKFLRSELILSAVVAGAELQKGPPDHVDDRGLESYYLLCALHLYGAPHECCNIRYCFSPEDGLPACVGEVWKFACRRLSWWLVRRLSRAQWTSLDGAHYAASDFAVVSEPLGDVVSSKCAACPELWGCCHSFHVRWTQHACRCTESLRRSRAAESTRNWLT